MDTKRALFHGYNLLLFILYSFGKYVIFLILKNPKVHFLCLAILVESLAL